MLGDERDYVGYAGKPPAVEWPGDARVCVSIGVNYEEGAEYSLSDDGHRETVGEFLSPVPPELRDVHTESMYEYGSRVGVWRLLEILSEYSASASFHVSGLAAECNPTVAKEIVARGHDVVGHGYKWQEYWRISEDQQRDDIARCVRAIASTTGTRPVGWLSRSSTPLTRRLVKEEGFIYDMSSFNDDLPYYELVDGQPFLIMPYSLELNDIKCWRGGLDNKGLTDAFVDGFDRLYEEGARAPKILSIGLHTRITGTPARSQILARFLDYVMSKDRVWIARRNDIADWWLSNQPPNVIDSTHRRSE